MKTTLFIAVGAVATIALAVAFVRTRIVKPVRVTAADIPRVLAAVSASTRTPTFAAFVFTTPDQPDTRDAVNLQFSLENGRAGLDWVLLAPRNLKDKDTFIDYLQRRGFSYSERKMNGVAYLRVEDGDLAQLCSDVVIVSVACLAAPAPGPEEDFAQAERDDRVIARSLDIDYRKCATVVLADQLRQLSKTDTAYVSIMGEDPDPATLAALRKAHSRTKLYSQAPTIPPDVRHSTTWSFYFGRLRAAPSGEYTAEVGYHCGSLCAGGETYRLKRDGDSCSIVSSKVEWMS